MKAILDRIDQRLQFLKMSRQAACLKAGLSRDAIRNWERALARDPNAKPNVASIEKLAAILQVSVNWILTGAQITADFEQNELISEIDADAKGRCILNSSEQNGAIVINPDHVRDHWRIPERTLSRLGIAADEIAAVPVKGDSMQPTLSAGDVVFIDLRHRAPSPDGIYAIADDFGGVVVKRLEVVSEPGTDDPVIRIISDNAKHAPKQRALSKMLICGRCIGRFSAC